MNNHLVVPDEIKKHLSGDAFKALMQMPGKAFRDVRGRKTSQVALGGKSYFIKQHFLYFFPLPQIHGSFRPPLFVFFLSLEIVCFSVRT